MDYLAEARELVDIAATLQQNEEFTVQMATQCAIACALVALAERLDALTEFGGDKSLYVITTRATTR